MTVHKPHSSEQLHEDDSPSHQQSLRKQSRRDNTGVEVEGDDAEEEEELKDTVSEQQDSDGSRSSDDLARLPEWIPTDLLALRTYVQCPICLGIIKKTRTVMECLHRFCRACIDKSMRLGNNECPACRTHCASRRSLRDDPRFDAMIAALFQDIEKFEEEELAFHEEEVSRNKQIQESIAQIILRQSEAVPAKRRKNGKEVSTVTARSQRNYRHSYSRRKRKNRDTDLEGPDENEVENDHEGRKNSSSADDAGRETKWRRYNRRNIGTRPCSSAMDSDNICIDNDLEIGKESRGVSFTPFFSTEILGWGGAAARSKCLRSTRLAKLKGFLENSKVNDDKLDDVHLMLIPLDTKRMPCLKQPYLYCPPGLLVEHLNHYVARETDLQAEDVEILLVRKSSIFKDGQQGSRMENNGGGPSELLDLGDETTTTTTTTGLQALQGKDTIGELRNMSASDMSHLVLAYRETQSSNV
ncbi:putative E3 ubiquitin-protein ligase RING1a [Impatiens glandulifera]|uniref:putative E3 ubiquitin-protein ligase RING1a n=1 Tax=Impatiens glandulifera TaxID=253017 RepID=UPI001FB05561|nr:putative E3 ubiquitin-protein ligase RING1a [Impatiens glandulifera]